MFKHVLPRRHQRQGAEGRLAEHVGAFRGGNVAAQIRLQSRMGLAELAAAPGQLTLQRRRNLASQLDESLHELAHGESFLGRLARRNILPDAGYACGTRSSLPGASGGELAR
jgi:hypothetical protein